MPNSSRKLPLSIFLVSFLLLAFCFGGHFILESKLQNLSFLKNITSSLWNYILIVFIVLIFPSCLFILNRFHTRLLSEQNKLIDSLSRQLKTIENNQEKEEDGVKNTISKLENNIQYKISELERWVNELNEKGVIKPEPNNLTKSEIKGFFDRLEETAVLACYSLLRISDTKTSIYEGIFKFYLKPIAALNSNGFDFILVRWFDDVVKVLVWMGLIEFGKEIKMNPLLKEFIIEKIETSSFKDDKLREIFLLIKS